MSKRRARMPAAKSRPTQRARTAGRARESELGVRWEDTVAEAQDMVAKVEASEIWGTDDDLDRLPRMKVPFEQEAQPDLPPIDFAENPLAGLRLEADDLEHAGAKPRGQDSPFKDMTDYVDLTKEMMDREGPICTASEPIVSATRLVDLVAVVLPAHERVRWAEEIRCELWDLADAGASRQRQLAYAIRVLVCGSWLSVVLRTHARKRAMP